MFSHYQSDVGSMFEELKHKLNNLQLNERLLGLQSAQTDDQRTLYYVENCQKSRNLQRRQIVCNLCLAEKYFIIRDRVKIYLTLERNSCLNVFG